MRYVGYMSVIVLLCTVSSCAINPVTGEKELMLFSDAQEIELGKNADPDIRWQFSGVYNDDQLTKYVDSVGQRAAVASHRSNIPYRFAVVDSSVVNAFALPGGYIYITRGLLVRLGNEAQLAAVLGHEIGHVTARHGVKRLQYTLGFNVLLAAADGVAAAGSEGYRQHRVLAQTVSVAAYSIAALGYSRENEFQADELGTIYAHKAGYDPEGMIQLLEVLRSMHDHEPSWIGKHFMSHPPTPDRIEAVRKQITQFPPEQGKKQLKESEHKARIRDLVVAQKAYNHYDKAEEHRKKNKYQEALTEYKNALKIKRNLAKPHHGIGLVYQAQNKHNRAIEEFKTAAKIDPDYTFVYNSMGISYIGTKRYSSAIPVLKKAVQIYENFGDAHANLGEAYYELKQYPEAIESLEMAIALNEKHPRAHITLGLTYEATGNTTKAIEEYNKAISVAPDGSHTSTARQRLKQLEG